MVVQIDPIIPERLVNNRIPEQVYSVIQGVVVNEIRQIEKEFGKGTSTWSSSSKPNWRLRITRGFAISGTCTTGDTPFAYVEVGTRYRFRAMTPDFRPKTKPGVLGSGPGAGGPSHFVRRPLPGIKGRGFRDIIARNRFPIFQANVEAALVDLIRRSV